MREKIVIIGAGGHGKVVLDAILAQDVYDFLGFVDASLLVDSLVINGYKVIEKQENIHLLKNRADVFIVAIGNNEVRNRVYETAKHTLRSGLVIHPSAIIGSDVTVGSGSVLLANTVINASAVIGENTLINTGVIVDHDCSIGSNIHLAVGTIVGSNSTIEDFYTTTVGQVIPSFSKIDK